MPARKHHFLAACRVTFEMPDGNPGVSEHNAMLIQDRREISMKGIGQIQTAAQIQFRKQVTDDPKIGIRDVFILGISYLGHMSEAEWKTTTQPEQTTQVSPEPGSHALLNPANPLDQSRGEQYVSAIDSRGDG